jgi:hypothetical protein
MPASTPREARDLEAGKTPLRGEAAWRASRAEIAKRNDAARAAGARRRAAHEAEAAEEVARQARLDVLAAREQRS